MHTPLLIAAVLTVAVGIAHSYLGERLILIPLFRTQLPKVLGSSGTTRRVLRFAWHLTSIAWWGFAALLYLLAAGEGPPLRSTTLTVIAVTFAIHALITGGMSRGRHFAWIVFLAIAVLSWTAR